MTPPKKPFYLTITRWQRTPSCSIGGPLIVAECDTERELNAMYEMLRSAESEINYQVHLLDEVLRSFLLLQKDLEKLKKRLGNHDIPLKMTKGEVNEQAKDERSHVDSRSAAANQSPDLASEQSLKHYGSALAPLLTH